MGVPAALRQCSKKLSLPQVVASLRACKTKGLARTSVAISAQVTALSTESGHRTAELDS